MSVYSRIPELEDGSAHFSLGGGFRNPPSTRAPRPLPRLLLLFVAVKDKEKSKMEFNENDEASDGGNVSFARLLLALSIMHVWRISRACSWSSIWSFPALLAPAGGGAGPRARLLSDAKLVQHALREDLPVLCSLRLAASEPPSQVDDG